MSGSDDPATFKDARSPFSGTDNTKAFYTPSDFILRSCDGVDFHLHKDLLKLVSGCFDGMFSFPGGDADPCALMRDGKPIVVLPEPESVLQRLLSLAYPAQSPKLYLLQEDDLDGVIALHAAAHKYQFIHVQHLLEEMLGNSDLLDAHPHRLFAIARLCDLRDLAREAALSTLKYDVHPTKPEFPEMKVLTWDHAHKLLTFHRLCGARAKEIAEENMLSSRRINAGTRDADGNVVTTHWQFFVWWGAKDHGSECGPTSEDGSITGPAPWFSSLAARLAHQLYLIPSGSTAETEALSFTPAERAIIDECPGCSQRAERDLRIYTRELALEINNSHWNLMMIDELF
ncbi:hypothetical protein K438DRAFT_1695370 [Mycena galopus ATCC 62051]|nr:hypothetical protein K438DRAFT_1695370 [Mycena galopus ATCC 62051]